MKLIELMNYGIPKDIINCWEERGFEDLLPIQEEAIKNGLLDGKSLLVIAPTSSGKTFVGEIAIIKLSLDHKKALYLTPSKAISEEKYIEFQKKYSNLSINLNVRLSNSDHRDNDDEICIGNYDIAILTYEKLKSLLTINNGILDCCNCIIVDEVQMVMDKTRGGNLELLLTKIKESVGKPQIIALSAVLSELNGFDKWLGAETIRNSVRPVELRQGIVKPDGEFEYTEWNTKTEGVEKFPGNSINTIIEYLLNNNEQVIIIRNSVTSTQDFANQLAEHFSSLPAAAQSIQSLNNIMDTETKEDLLNTLRHSIAFHHAECELEERTIIEDGFRKGEIKILCATTTLSQGVNLPCRSVILYDITKWETVRNSPQQVDWKISEVCNILGRAGRLNCTDGFGRGIFIANNEQQYGQIKRAYFNKPMESFHSSLEYQKIDLYVLDIVATGFAKTKKEVYDLLLKTYAAQTWINNGYQNIIKENIDGIIDYCSTNELIKYETAFDISITPLGKICAANGCSIESFLRLKEYIEGMKSFDRLDMLFAVSGVKEIQQDFYRGVSWNYWPRRQRVTERANTANSEDKLINIIKHVYDRLSGCIGQELMPQFTFSLLVEDILSTNHRLRELSDAYIIRVASIRKICDSLSWMINITSEIAKIILNGSVSHDIKVVSECVLNRVPLDCRFLNKLDVNLNRDEKIRLYDAGYKSEDDFIDKKGSDFIGLLNPTKANRIIESINQNRTKDHVFWVREHTRRLDMKGINTKYIDLLYSLKGIDLENIICDLFNLGFTQCSVIRIADQKSGEPDLLMTFPSGKKFTIQVTAKDDNTKFVDSKKAGDVIPQSAKFHPDGYICIARPDFQDLAIENASYLAKDYNYKLLPIYVLAELYVQFHENKIISEEATSFIYNSRGYLQANQIGT